MTENGRQRRRADRDGASDAGAEPTRRRRGRHEADEPDDEALDLFAAADDEDRAENDDLTDDVDSDDDTDDIDDDTDRDDVRDRDDDGDDSDPDDASPAERRRRRAAKASVASRGSTSTATRSETRRSTSTRPASKAPAKSGGRSTRNGSRTTTGPARRGGIGRFLREVIAELAKVIWPGRKQLITYTVVVLVFVSFMVALISGLDFLFAQGVIAVFG